jgi:hypothetical protein
VGRFPGIALFRFRPLDAVILNKAMSLIVVTAACGCDAVCSPRPDAVCCRGSNTRSICYGHRGRVCDWCGRSFVVLKANAAFVQLMAIGSVLRAFAAGCFSRLYRRSTSCRASRSSFCCRPCESGDMPRPRATPVLAMAPYSASSLVTCPGYGGAAERFRAAR